MLPITAATSGGSKLFVDEGFPMLNYAYLVVNALKPNEPPSALQHLKFVDIHWCHQ